MNVKHLISCPLSLKNKNYPSILSCIQDTIIECYLDNDENIINAHQEELIFDLNISWKSNAVFRSASNYAEDFFTYFNYSIFSKHDLEYIKKIQKAISVMYLENPQEWEEFNLNLKNADGFTDDMLRFYTEIQNLVNLMNTSYVVK